MTAEQRKRWMKYAAIAGAVIGMSCHFVPEKYKAACEAVSQITAVTCGAGG